MNEAKPSIFHRRPLLSFFGLSILLFIPFFVLAGIAFTVETPSWIQYPTQALSSWSPTFAALIVTAAINGRVALPLTTLTVLYLVFALIIVFATGSKNLSMTKERPSIRISSLDIHGLRKIEPIQERRRTFLMKITILNGNPHSDNPAFDDYLNCLSDTLSSDGHAVTLFPLRDMDLKYCIGCLDCWVKTPGLCVTDDEGRDVCRAYINSDFVLWASPVIMGFYSALLKTVTDKFTGLVMPYAVFVEGLSRHMARYDSYPLTGLLLEKNSDTDDVDIRIISDIHERTSINFKSRSAFTKLTLDPVEDVAHEITREIVIGMSNGGGK